MIDKMLLSATAVALGLVAGALPALAEYDYELYGGPTQTWCDVNPDCNGWNKRLHGPAYRSNAYELVAPRSEPANKKHRPSPKRSRDPIVDRY
jgi:hypothetical protein